MNNRLFPHSPACQESPTYCICKVQNRQGWPSPNPTMMPVVSQVTAEQHATGNYDEAALFKHPGTLTPKRFGESDRAARAGKSDRSTQKFYALIAELKDARSQVRFWRRQAVFLCILTTAWMVLAILLAMDVI